jgi:hypothetical protein
MRFKPSARAADRVPEVGLERSTRTLALTAMLVLCCAAGATAGLGPNPANDRRLIDRPIEDYRYDRATRCKQRTPDGTKALVRWLGRHTDGSNWGTYRCEKWGKGSYSVHSESRAVDWAMDARKRAQRRQAMKLIRKRFLATDRRGNDNALARRMGIQGIIYDCRSWYSRDGGLGRYSYCYKDNGKRKRNLDPTAAHVDHIHIELNDPGSRGRTSFWKSKLARR